jgi:hypothetical protein
VKWFRRWRQRKTMALLALRSGFFGEFAPSVFRNLADAPLTSPEDDDRRALMAVAKYLRAELWSLRLTEDERARLTAELARVEDEIRELSATHVTVNYPDRPNPEHSRSFRRKRQERLSLGQVVALWLLAKCLRMVLR